MNTSQKLQARARQQDPASMGDVVPIDQAAVLRTLGFDPRDPNTQAALLICGRYGLDPVMKHIVLINGNPYITRDGYLTIAHRSGQLDGIEVLEQGEDDTHWTAKVAVYRKDMSRRFAYVGRHPKNSGNKYGPEMAVKTAEVMALRRAFEVTGAGAADEQWDAQEPVTARAEIVPDRIGPGGAHDLNEWLRDVLGDDTGMRDRLRGWWSDNDLPMDSDTGRPDLAAITPAQRDVIFDVVSSWLPNSPDNTEAADVPEATVEEAGDTGAVESRPGGTGSSAVGSGLDPEGPWDTDDEDGDEEEALA